MQEFTIGEAARQLGLSPSALRYYERRGIFPPPRRVNGQRRYTQAQIHELAALRFAQRAGFTLAEVRRLLAHRDSALSFGTAWRRHAQQKLVELDAQLAAIQHMKQIVERSLACDCAGLEACELVRNVLEHR